MMKKIIKLFYFKMFLLSYRSKQKDVSLKLDGRPVSFYLLFRTDTSACGSKKAKKYRKEKGTSLDIHAKNELKRKTYYLSLGSNESWNS